MYEAPFTHNTSSTADNAAQAIIGKMNIMTANPCMDGKVIDPLFTLFNQCVPVDFPGEVFHYAIHFFKCLINRNSAYWYGTITDNPFTCFMDVFSCGKIHQRVSTPFAAPQCFLHFFINAGGSSRISDVRIDFYKEVTSDNHRFSFRVVDVGR